MLGVVLDVVLDVVMDVTKRVVLGVVLCIVLADVRCAGALSIVLPRQASCRYMNQGGKW